MRVGDALGGLMAWSIKLANRTLFLICLAGLNAQFANAELSEEPDIHALVDGLAEVETINRPAIVALPRIERMLAEGQVEEAKAGFLNWCGEGARLACLRHLELSLDAEAPDNSIDARIFYDKSCESGSAPACTRLGVLLDSTDGGGRDVLGAKEAFLAGCKGRHPEGCVMYADMMIIGVGGPAGHERAGLLIAQACLVGSALGCFSQGVLAEREGRVDEALDLYGRSCTNGYFRACLSFYIRKARAAAIEEQFDKAYAHYETACALDEGPRGLACFRAAEFAAFPENPEAGSERAQQLYQRACDFEYSRACDRLSNARPSAPSNPPESALENENEPR